METAATNPYPTVQAALAAGFCHKRKDDYAGEEIVVKGRTLVRGATQALSRAAWSRRGFRVKEGAEPHAVIFREVLCAGKAVKYGVYREDQVEPRRKATCLPPQTIPVLAALWAVNRRAKWCRDRAPSHDRRGHYALACRAARESARLYRLASRALHHLLDEDLVAHAGYHCYPEGDWAQLLTGGGYSFHRPCPPSERAMVEQREEIESKPMGQEEPRLKDALHTVRVYLEGRPEVEVYRWPPRVRRMPLSCREGWWDWDEDPLD